MTRLEHRFDHRRFSGLPGGTLAAELEAADPHTLDDDELADYLRACRRLEAWAGSRLARGIAAFAHSRAVPDHDQGTADATGSIERRLARPVQFGGEGTPLVDEHAADELAPCCRWRR